MSTEEADAKCLVQSLYIIILVICNIIDGFFILSVAPLCFLYHEPSKLYQIFREMYVRFFFRLHSISSHPSVSSRELGSEQTLNLFLFLLRKGLLLNEMIKQLILTCGVTSVFL